MNKPLDNLSTLINTLKTEDSRLLQISKVIQGMYWFIIPLYIFMTVHDQIKEFNILDLISGVCSILAFLIFFLYFRFSYKELKQVNYDLPTIEMLKKVVNRYNPVAKKTWWIIMALLLIDVSISISNFMEDGSFRSLLIFQGMFILVISLSGAIGYFVWGRKQKPLQEAAKRLITELES